MAKTRSTYVKGAGISARGKEMLGKIADSFGANESETLRRLIAAELTATKSKARNYTFATDTGPKSAAVTFCGRKDDMKMLNELCIYYCATPEDMIRHVILAYYAAHEAEIETPTEADAPAEAETPSEAEPAVTQMPLPEPTDDPRAAFEADLLDALRSIARELKTLNNAVWSR